MNYTGVPRSRLMYVGVLTRSGAHWHRRRRCLGSRHPCFGETHAADRNGNPRLSRGSGCGMQCGAAGGAAALSPTERSPAKSHLHVNFSDKGEVKERREKFLTAKYGSHQMALIRKRLAVEMWLYDELQKLYETSEGRPSREVEVDIDELLDMDGDEPRRAHLTNLLADAKKPQKDVHKFINELLLKAKTL